MTIVSVSYWVFFVLAMGVPVLLLIRFIRSVLKKGAEPTTAEALQELAIKLDKLTEAIKENKRE